MLIITPQLSPSATPIKVLKKSKATEWNDARNEHGQEMSN